MSNTLFEGIRIIDFSSVVSGPMATQILADQGADVIKVESPGVGDISRLIGANRNGFSSMFTVLNRNKRSVVINLKSKNSPNKGTHLSNSKKKAKINNEAG